MRRVLPLMALLLAGCAAQTNAPAEPKADAQSMAETIATLGKERKYVHAPAILGLNWLRVARQVWKRALSHYTSASS